jgi:cell division protein FtsB
MRKSFDSREKELKKKKKGRASGSMITKLLMGLLVLFLLAGAVGIYFTQETQFARIEAKASELNAEAEKARKELQDFEKLFEKSDSLEYIEKIAREQLGMVKPGETVFSD